MKVERVIFYEGMVYQIEEEIFSEDDHSSVYTSEDSFEEDERLLDRLKQETNKQRNIGTAGTDLNSIQSSHFAGFVEHKENIQRMLSKVSGLGPTRPESQSADHTPLFVDQKKPPLIDLSKVDGENQEEIEGE